MQEIEVLLLPDAKLSFSDRAFSVDHGPCP